MRIRAGLIIVLLLTLGIGKESFGAKGLPVVRIGVVTDGPMQPLGWGKAIQNKVFQKEILDITKGEFNVQFPSRFQVHGKWNVGGVKAAVAYLLKDPKVHLVLALGVIASDVVARQRNLPKPVIAPFIVDKRLQGLPFRKGKSGVKNLNYLTTSTSLDRDLRTFKEIFPITRLALLGDQTVLVELPHLKEKVDQVARKNDVTITLVPVGTSIRPALAALPSDIDGVLVTPLLRLSPREFDALVSGLIDRGLPSFSHFGREEVERGLMAGVAPETDTFRLARRVALNVQRILLGENAGNLGVDISQQERLTINMDTVRKAGTWPSFRVLTEAELLKEEEEVFARRVSLYKVVREAIASNLDLAAFDRRVAGGIGDINNARAALLPQIGFDTDFIQIWQRTTSVDGGKPQNLGQVGGSFKQLLFSDKAWSDYTVEQKAQDARVQLRQQLRLDVARNAAVGYLDVLRTKTIEGIQKDNLKLTRTNLELARVRVAVGQAARDEVFRWENEIANGRIAVLDAQAQTRQARVALNRVLHRPLEEPFMTQETGLHDPLLLVGQKRLFAYLNNPQSFKVFRDFEVQEGLNASPLIKRLNALITGQQRTVLNSQRAFWAPELSLSSQVTQRFLEDGPGTGTAGQNVTLGTQLAETRTTVFSQVSLDFPLFAGGSKDATQITANEELRRLQLRRESTVGRVEERIRSALFLAGASFPGIRLSREAAEAARKNYELVLDQYRRGVVDIIKLVNTQTNYLNANLAASNAVYDFLVDLMNIQQSVGRFDYFQDSEKREAWFQRLEVFFAKAGVKPVAY